MERATKRKVMTKALRRLAKGEPMKRSQMVDGISDYSQQKGGIRPFLCVVVNRLKEQDLAVEDEQRNLLGDTEKLKAILADNDALTNLFWPGTRPEPEPEQDDQPLWPSPDVRQRVIDGALELSSLQGIVAWVFSLVDYDPEATSTVLDDIRQDIPLLAKAEPWYQKTAKAIDIAVHESEHVTTPDSAVNPTGGPENEPAPIAVDEAMLKMMYAVMKSNEEILERLSAQARLLAKQEQMTKAVCDAAVIAIGRNGDDDSVAFMKAYTGDSD